MGESCRFGYVGDGTRGAGDGNGCVDIDGCAETVYDDAPCFAGVACAARGSQHRASIGSPCPRAREPS